MPERSKKDDGTRPPASLSLVLMMVGTLADTTWRLFLPTIGGTILGIWADRSFDTKPWFTTAGVIAGAAIAFLLIYLQIRKVQK